MEWKIREYGESDKSLKQELGSRFSLLHVISWRNGSILVAC